MTKEEKIQFLMETIPSEEEVVNLKRRFLFGNLEAELLKDASATLRTSSPDSALIDWAYALLQFHFDREWNKEKRQLPLQEKMERIIALFSNNEDLQRILEAEEWSASERRAIQLVSHFVTNGIPLMTNIKLVEKVHRLLANAYLPPDLASKYFGLDDFERERERILEKYLAYKEKRERLKRNETPLLPEKPSIFKRYAYILGAVTAIVVIFLAGFFTAKFLYKEKMSGVVASPPAGDISTLQKPQTVSKQLEMPHSVNLEKKFIDSRVVLQKRFERLGFGKKVDFVSRVRTNGLEKRRPEEKLLGADAASSSVPAPAHRRNVRFQIAVSELGKLKGLKLPIPAHETNETLASLPEGFELHAAETPASRVLYLMKGGTTYPLEIYSFIGEPIIMEYTLIAFKRGHYLAVPSQIWYFSDIGDLRTHRRYVYQKGKMAPAKIITNHFLPGDESIYLVSVGKLDRKQRQQELLLERRDYLPSGKLLYQERREIDRLTGHWRSRIVERIWYDEGHKILTKTSRNDSFSEGNVTEPLNPPAKKGIVVSENIIQ